MGSDKEVHNFMIGSGREELLFPRKVTSSGKDVTGDKQRKAFNDKVIRNRCSLK